MRGVWMTAHPILSRSCERDIFQLRGRLGRGEREFPRTMTQTKWYEEETVEWTLRKVI